MKKQIDLLVVYPLPVELIENIENIFDYGSMQASFMHQHLKNIKDLKIQFLGTSYEWITEYNKDKDQQLIDKLNENGINIHNIKNILITGVQSSKCFKGESISNILSKISGKIYQMADSNNFVLENVHTVGYYDRLGVEHPQASVAGLAVNTELFRPNKNLKDSFIVHIDHRMLGRYEHFDKIKEKLYLIKDIVSKSNRWSGLEIYYHSELVTDINVLGTYDPAVIKIIQLKEIYSKSHLAFVSHAETLGQYPLEMLSCGTTIITGPKLIPKQVARQIVWNDIDAFDYEKYITEVSEKDFQKNRDSVLNYDYKNFINNIIRIIFK